jgi:tRNA(adenine34) deaminase
MTETDRSLLRASIELAHLAREHGNHPFGSLLADAKGNVLLRAENTVITESDCTGHAETNLMRMASQIYSPEKLATCTLYTSTEPCPMCAGAIFWGNVQRVVYALSQEELYALTGDSPDKLPLSCREVFAHAGRPVEVLGPALEDEARQVHKGFWRADIFSPYPPAG